MALKIKSDPVPLVDTGDGAIRVRGTRIPLDTVITAFQMGDTPEHIVASFTTLKLADVYAILAYYMRHQPDVDAYLEERRIEAEQLRAEIEARFPSDGIRERLLARRGPQAAEPDDPSSRR